jgi:hypothetical protein
MGSARAVTTRRSARDPGVDLPLLLVGPAQGHGRVLEPRWRLGPDRPREWPRECAGGVTRASMTCSPRCMRHRTRGLVDSEEDMRMRPWSVG